LTGTIIGISSRLALPATTVIELKILAAKKGVTVVSLVEEAVALLLAQYKDDFT